MSKNEKNLLSLFAEEATTDVTTAKATQGIYYSDADWQNSEKRANGEAINTIASSLRANTLWRQNSLMAYVLAQYIANNTDEEVSTNIEPDKTLQDTANRLEKLLAKSIKPGDGSVTTEKLADKTVTSEKLGSIIAKSEGGPKSGLTVSLTQLTEEGDAAPSGGLLIDLKGEVTSIKNQNDDGITPTPIYLWVGTSAQYDAIQHKDSKTLYFYYD